MRSVAAAFTSDRIPDTVQPTEVIWTLIGVIGLVITVPLLWNFIRDLIRFRRDGKNGGDEILAKTYIGIVGALCCIQAVVTGVGALAMMVPPARHDVQVTTTGLIVTCGLVSIILLSDFAALWLSLYRFRLRLYLRSRAGKEFLSDILSKENAADGNTGRS